MDRENDHQKQKEKGEKQQEDDKKIEDGSGLDLEDYLFLGGFLLVTCGFAAYVTKEQIRIHVLEAPVYRGWFLGP